MFRNGDVDRKFHIVRVLDQLILKITGAVAPISESLIGGIYVTAKT
jgi:hypothetical protein